MKILIDSADLDKIKELYEYYPICGVTTNPSILLRNGKDAAETLKQLKTFCGQQELHVQVIGETCAEYLADAKAIIEVLGKDTYIKIPAYKEGFKAMKILSEQGARITATAIYYPGQALIASKIGVDYIAPYFNRICKQGYDGLKVLETMQRIINDTPTKILAASFKTRDQVCDVADLQVEAMTLPVSIFEQLEEMAEVDKTIKAFNEDFYTLTGTHSSLKDVLKT